MILKISDGFESLLHYGSCLGYALTSAIFVWVLAQCMLNVINKNKLTVKIVELTI